MKEKRRLSWSYTPVSHSDLCSRLCGKENTTAWEGFLHLFRCVSGFYSIIMTPKLQCPFDDRGTDVCDILPDVWGWVDWECRWRRPAPEATAHTAGCRWCEHSPWPRWRSSQTMETRGTISNVSVHSTCSQTVLNMFDWPGSTAAPSPLCCSCWAPSEGSTCRGRKRSQWKGAAKQTHPLRMFPYKQTTVDTRPTGTRLLLWLKPRQGDRWGMQGHSASHLLVPKTPMGRRSWKSWKGVMSSSASGRKKKNPQDFQDCVTLFYAVFE